MPSRQISPQSFDDILSELGDDPAIPDPHGIRKNNSPKPPSGDRSNRLPTQDSNSPKSLKMPALNELKRIGLLIGFGVAIVASGGAIFIATHRDSDEQDIQVQALKDQITQVQKELVHLRDEVQDIEESLYESIDLIEVSIHSLKESKRIIHTKNKAIATPYEEVLRLWRYLGSSYIGDSQRAFFHDGNAAKMYELGSVLLGEWRLVSANKESATITHIQGKSLQLKTSKPQ